MRILRQKQHRKTLRFFRMMFNVKAPFRVLLDGNFIHLGLRTSAEVYRLLPSLLQERPENVRMFVTGCVLNELRELGDDFAETLHEARRYRVARCGHGSKHVSAGDCIRSLVGDTNKDHYVVASQDPALRDTSRNVPGTPIVLLTQSVLVLEPPSDASKSAAQASETKKLVVPAEERKLIGALARAHEATTVADAAKAEQEAGAGSAAAAPVKRKRRKGPKEPNPLSVKKKKKDASGETKKTKTRRGKRAKKSGGAGQRGAVAANGGAGGGSASAAGGAGGAAAARRGRASSTSSSSSYASQPSSDSSDDDN